MGTSHLFRQVLSQQPPNEKQGEQIGENPRIYVVSWGAPFSIF
jgi:hypothetical protein